MSTTLNLNNTSTNGDDDVWFDAPEELFEDALESHDDDMLRWKELHAYVPNPEKGHNPELPTIALQKKISAFYYQEQTPFEEHDPNLQEIFRIEEALGTLQTNHSNAIEKEDRKFISILSRFDKAINQASRPENPRTDADLKKVRHWYTTRLNEITRTQELLEREYLVEYKGLEMQFIAIENEWHANQKSLAEHNEMIADHLVMEDRVRWGLRRQKQLEHLNYEMQDLSNEQCLKIQELEFEAKKLQQENYKNSFITQQIIIQGEGQILVEASNIYARYQQIYQPVRLPDFEVYARQDGIVMMPDGQQQWVDYNSYYNEVEYEGDEGRFYALYSRDQNKRAFAHKKFTLDIKKRFSDEAEQAANPLQDNHDFIQNWMVPIPNPLEFTQNSSAANDISGESHSGKRAFGDYAEDEEVEGHGGRKRLRPISVIPRSPSPPCMLAQTCQKDPNGSQKSWEEPGYLGHDGNYYGPGYQYYNHDGQYFFYPEYVPDPPTPLGEVQETPIYIDTNNGGPPLRRSTPPPRPRRVRRLAKLAPRKKPRKQMRLVHPHYDIPT
ncbi:24f51c89-815a-4819-8bc6-c2bbab504f4d [Sclerotinia trifoliorum]|uniref:24f51c89-815a-4819-8bc6-c2bbab504f4d n=1 Tax=Sclerotinia trifoliorum TaxID=28548 RepID=A0A8H2VLA7_9HELO|nr:24f51c89-815a-4819-8bc6-c2bbab504f4d [Sclerotinia trifoliorum]